MDYYLFPNFPMLHTENVLKNVLLIDESRQSLEKVHSPFTPKRWVKIISLNTWH